MPRQMTNQNLFPYKLDEILNNQQVKPIIRWGISQQTIQIHDLEKFQDQILPSYFRHNKYQSFVRQMNLYGFKKSRNPKLQIFTNKELKHGKKITDLLSRNQKIRLRNLKISKKETKNVGNKACIQLNRKEQIEKSNKQHEQQQIQKTNILNYANFKTIEDFKPVYQPTYLSMLNNEWNNSLLWYNWQPYFNSNVYSYFNQH